MPYIEGESLRDRLRRETQLPVEDALQIAREVADALAYAHGRASSTATSSRRTSCSTSGHALVADFGIARRCGRRDGGRLTETGLAVGTRGLHEPGAGERRARRSTARSDVYSLGCVLYEMLAGEPPYTGPTAQAIIAKRFSDPVPSVRRLRGAIPVPLDQAVMRALAPVPADRFATAVEFARALQSTMSTPVATATVPPAATAPVRRRGRVVIALASMAAAALIGLGAVVARHMSGEGEPELAKLLAVLPFENLGTQEDEDFSDGMAEEVRGRLSTVPGVAVIARGSSMGYKKTPKPPEQIARELGVEYLLTATVRWGKKADGQRTVRVTPELVRVGGDGPPKTAWQRSFDVSVTDAFDVYGDIAGRVAQALGVTFGDSMRQQLAEKPTQETTAYDAYLRGEAISQSLGLGDPAVLRKAMPYYEKAVALDSSFLRAWAQLSRARSLLYFNSTPTPEIRESARLAAERSVALAPDRSEGHHAMGAYLYWVAKDYARAEQEFARARQVAPNDADLLATSALAEMALGKWDTALTNLRRAQRLDPRSSFTASAITWALLHLRRYPEAREAADRALTLAPADPALLQHKAMVFLAEGDLAGARGVLASAPPESDTASLFTQFVHYFELAWVLNDAQQQLVLRSTPGDFGDDRSAWAIGLANIYWRRGDPAKARAYADTARTAVEEQLRAEPSDAQRHELYGICLAFLGRRNEAVREGQRAVTLLPVAKDANFGAYLQHQLVRIYILVGEPENALDHLEPLLKMPYYLSSGWLRIDPEFQPLRGNPRFQMLTE